MEVTLGQRMRTLDRPENLLLTARLSRYWSSRVKKFIMHIWARSAGPDGATKGEARFYEIDAENFTDAVTDAVKRAEAEGLTQAFVHTHQEVAWQR